jgi:hypothetical protein
MVQLTDTLTIDQDARICADGSLVAEVFAARTGLQDYLGAEVDPEGSRFKADATVKVYRPESEVFKIDSLATYAAAPVTLDHPADPVTADNWRAHGVGEINGDVARDGQRVRVPIIVRDAAAVKAATTTHKQLSMGYATDLKFPADGKHPDGTACDAYQTDLKINHIALVRAARGGPELRVVDERPDPKEPTMKIKIGDAEVDATNGEAVRIAVDALNTKLTALDKRATDAEAKVVEHAATVTARDAKIVELEAKVADSAITPAKLRDAAKEFADTIAKAKALGVTVADDADTASVMKAVVDAKMGDAAKDYTADHIAIAFSALTKDAKLDDAGKVVNISPVFSVTDAETSFADVQRKLSEQRRNAWKNPASAAAA